MDTIEVRFQPDGLRIAVEPGTLLTHAMRTLGIALPLPCGGTGRCGKCAVEIHPAPPEPGPTDRLHLTPEELGRGMRIACRTRVDRPMTVLVAPVIRAIGEKILVDGHDRAFDLDPAVDPDVAGRKYGMAFDLGTTTVAGTLLDLSTGHELSRGSRLNAQRVYGEDTISRIKYARDTEGGLADLTGKIRSVVNEIIGEAAARAEIDPHAISEAVFVGNTTISHLFAGLDPSGLAEIPFTPATRDALTLRAGDAGIGIHPEGGLYILPNIAGFVGSDTVGVMLAGDFLQPGPARLAVDVGTNGELALRRSDGAMMVCSTAAGPALEGAALSCGMRAADGAIEHVRITRDGVVCDVIGDTTPIGICGSGVIDIVAELLDHGIVDRSGRLLSPEELAGQIPGTLLARVIDTDGARAFLLARTAREDGAARDIVFTQRDIRQVQLAKGAIGAGIELILKDMGVPLGDLAEILLAGAFGNYIRVRSALRIGLLPPVSEERIRFVGNAALTGAKMALLSRAAREDADRIRHGTGHLELAAMPDFTDVFAEHMLFP